MMKKYKLVLFLIIGLGVILRLFKLEWWAGFDFDQETAAWWVKSFLVDKKLSLVGQETSVQGIFIGPLYYYFLSLFYFIFNFDPLGASVMTTIISIFTICLIYSVGKDLFGIKVGLMAAFLYSISFKINFYDRTTAPSNFIMWVAVLIFWFTIKLKFKINYLMGLSLLFGLALSVHPTLLFLMPAVLFYFFKNGNFKSYKISLFSCILFILFLMPILIFEFRHGFLITHELVQHLDNKSLTLTGFVLKVIENSKTYFVLIEEIILGSTKYWFIGALCLLSILKLSFFQLVSFFLFHLLFMIIMSIYPFGVPEYYFLSLVPILLIFFAGALVRYPLGLRSFVLTIIILCNTIAFFNYDNGVGLYYKKQTIKYLSRNNIGATKVMYDTDPGQGNGFKYLFWLENKDKHPTQFQTKAKYVIYVPSSRAPWYEVRFGDIAVAKID